MRNTMFLSAAVGLVLGLAAPGPIVAQDTSSEDLKTVLTVSVAGYDAVIESIDALAKVAGVPEMTMFPKMMLGGPAGPGGLDGSKPLGLVLQTDGQRFPATLFAPITDTEEFLEFLKRFVPDIPEPDDDGVYSIESGGQTVYVQQKGDWAFAVAQRAALADTPDDPTALLDGMEKEFALGIRVQVASIPEQLRDSALMFMQMAANSGSKRNEGETDEQYALRQKMTKHSLDEIQKLVKELESLTIGLAVDPTDGTINLDFVFTAAEGTSMAQEMALNAGLKSAFSGFFNPDAALTFRATSKISESDVTHSLQMLDIAVTQVKEAIESEDLGEAKTQLALEIGEDLLAVLKDTISGRTFDGGLSLVAGDDGIALIAGGHVVGGDKLDEIFKKVIEQAEEEEPDLDQFLKMDVAQYKGVNFHTLAVPAELVFKDGVPSAYSESDVKITVGFAESAVYVAHGADPVALLKAAIDRSAAASDAAIIPAQFSLSVRAIGSLLEIIGANEEADIPPELIAALKQAGAQDHVLVSAESIPRGMRVRMTVEGGILKVIAAAAKAGEAARQSSF